MTADSITGAFPNARDGSRLFTADSLGSFHVSYGPGSVSLSGYAVVPQPSSLAAMLLPTLLLRRRSQVMS